MDYVTLEYLEKSFMPETIILMINDKTTIFLNKNTDEGIFFYGRFQSAICKFISFDDYSKILLAKVCIGRRLDDNGCE